MITPVTFRPENPHGQTPRPAMVEWLVGEGDALTPGMPVCLYEIDKAVLEFKSPVTGVLRLIQVPAGARFSEGNVLAYVSDSPDDALPEAHYAPLPDEKDIHDFDWSEIDNHAGDPEPLGVMRRTIADRMAMSKRHIPCFYLTAHVDMSGCLALRKNLKRDGAKATFNDMAIKASAMALALNPRAAAIYTPKGLIPRTDLHIGFAAALPDDGLVVPVVKNADRKELTAIAGETRRLAEKAKQGALVPEDCSGGVFSVSYLGSFEVDNFVAIVNPGEAAILAVGQTRDTPVVVGGEVVVRPMVRLTLSCDHRSIDGSLGARLMGDIKRIMEHPEKMM